MTVILYNQLYYKYRGGMLSGIKVTNSLESVVNAAITFEMFAKTVLRVDKSAEIKMI